MGVKRGLKGVLFKSAGRRTLSLKFAFIISMLAPNNFFFGDLASLLRFSLFRIRKEATIC